MDTYLDLCLGRFSTPPVEAMIIFFYIYQPDRFSAYCGIALALVSGFAPKQDEAVTESWLVGLKKDSDQQGA